MEYNIQREQRERREFIYRHTTENIQRAKEEKKRKIRAAVDDNKPIPTDLRGDALALHKSLAYEDEGGEGIASLVDDEYRWAGVEDPRILVTTSRDPSSRLKTFAKEVRLIFPNSLRINRGNHGIDQLVQMCTSGEFTDLIVLKEHRGNPVGMVVSHMPHGPTAYFTLYNTVFRTDIEHRKHVSEEYPHLLFNDFSETKLARRVRDVLKYLFPVPKEDSHRVMTFFQKDDYILFRHSVYSKDESRRIKITEVGPRFDLFCYKIMLGRIDQEDTAEKEWEYAGKKRTAKKQKLYNI